MDSPLRATIRQQVITKRHTIFCRWRHVNLSHLMTSRSKVHSVQRCSNMCAAPCVTGATIAWLCSCSDSWNSAWHWDCKAQWSLDVSPVVTIRTASLTFSNSTFCPHRVFMCFVWIWEQTAIISLYSIDWLVFITETECVYCAVRTGS